MKNDAIAEAEARAARNGLRLEFDDRDAGNCPGMGFVSAHLYDGKLQVAGYEMTYHDDAGRERALRFCAERVYFRPDEAG
jgi:hypothetical protein